MSEDERIARLTELARQVYGDGIYSPEHGRPGSVGRSQDKLGGWHVLVMAGDGSYCPLEIREHPRALDALEVALLVLAGESCADDVVRGLAAQLCAERGDTLVRLSQLAESWKYLAAQLGEGEYADGARGALQRCWRELREALKP